MNNALVCVFIALLGGQPTSAGNPHTFSISSGLCRVTIRHQSIDHDQYTRRLLERFLDLQPKPSDSAHRHHAFANIILPIDLQS